MWGRATLTMVASRTTMSWAVRITKQEHRWGWRAAAGARPGLPGSARPPVSGRDSRTWWLWGMVLTTFPLIS